MNTYTEREKSIQNYQAESALFVKILVELQSYKMPNAILNIETGEISFNYGEDTSLEKEIKAHIANIFAKYNLNNGLVWTPGTTDLA